MRKPKRVAGLHGAGEAAAVVPETGVVTSVSGAGVVVPGSSKRTSRRNDLIDGRFGCEDPDGLRAKITLGWSAVALEVRDRCEAVVMLGRRVSVSRAPSTSGKLLKTRLFGSFDHA